jgi:hypothetical protein
MNAIVRGLAKQDRPVGVVHTSGTGVLLVDDFARKLPPGEEFDKVFDDWDGVGEVLFLPDSAPHREVEKVVLSVAEKYSQIKTAIFTWVLLLAYARLGYTFLGHYISKILLSSTSTHHLCSARITLARARARS